MMRILKIVPKRDEYRTDRMKTIQAWMTAHGWQLADYAGEAGSAAFARDEEAPRLPLFDPTRWLPGPDALKPREWWRTVRADPRWAIFPGGASFALLVVILSLVAPPSFLSQEAMKREEEAKWRYVTAPKLNVREAPSSTSQAVGILYKNQRVLLEGKVNAKWVKLGPPSRGYVASRFLSSQPTPPAKRKTSSKPQAPRGGASSGETENRPAPKTAGNRATGIQAAGAPAAPSGIGEGTARGTPAEPPALPIAPMASKEKPSIETPASKTVPVTREKPTTESKPESKPQSKPQSKVEEPPVKATPSPPALPSGGMPALPPPPPTLPSINSGG